MKNTDIGVILNPHAGPSRGKKEFNEVINFAHKNKIPFAKTNNIKEIPDVLREFLIKRQVKIILIYGGDGSLQKVVDFAIYKKDHELDADKKIMDMPLIGSLNGGTQGAVNQWLGIEGTPLHLLRKIWQTPREYLPIRKLRPLEISFINEDNKSKIHWGFMFLIGIIGIIRLYNEQRSVQNGIKHFILGISAALTGFPRRHKKMISQFNAELFVNHEKLPITQPLAAICSVTEHLLFGLQPFHGRREYNQFYCASYEINAKTLATMLPLIYRGTWVPGIRLIPAYSMLRQVAPKLTNVLNHDLLSKSIPGASSFFNNPVFNFTIAPQEENEIFLDGELYRIKLGTKVNIKLGPDVQFISAFGR